MFVSDDKKVVTRKVHRCEWCHTRIEKGERAITWGWVDGGQMFRTWMHPECVDAINRDSEDGWEGYSMGCHGRRGKSYQETDEIEATEREAEKRAYERKINDDDAIRRADG